MSGRDATPEGSEKGVTLNENDIKIVQDDDLHPVIDENRGDDSDFNRKRSQKASMRVSKLDFDVQGIAKQFSMNNDDTGDIHIEDLSKAFKSLMEEQEQRHDAERDRIEAEKEKEKSDQEKKKWQKVAIVVIVILIASYAVLFFTVFGITSAVVGGNNGIISDIVADAQIFEINEDGTIGRKGKKTKVKTVKARENKKIDDIFDPNFNFDELKSMTILIGKGFKYETKLNIAGHTKINSDKILLYTHSPNIPGILKVRGELLPTPLSAEGLNKFFALDQIVAVDELIDVSDSTDARRELKGDGVTYKEAEDNYPDRPKEIRAWNVTTGTYTTVTKLPEMGTTAEMTPKTDDWNVVANGWGAIYVPDEECTKHVDANNKAAPIKLSRPPRAFGFTDSAWTTGCWYVIHRNFVYGDFDMKGYCWGPACSEKIIPADHKWEKFPYCGRRLADSDSNSPRRLSETVYGGESGGCFLCSSDLEK